MPDHQETVRQWHERIRGVSLRWEAERVESGALWHDARRRLKALLAEHGSRVRKLPTPVT